jgi:uroporphyrinogen decarboxylase
MLDTKNYEEFSLYYIRQITAGLLRNYNSKRIPLILFTKAGNQWLEQMADTGCDAVGVDCEISLQAARERVGVKVALQGNMNPGFLKETPEAIQQEAQRILESYGQGSGHVFNLGHGITPDVPPEHVKVLVDAVHELGKRFHT